MNDMQHWRADAEVERYTVSDMQARAALECSLCQPPVFDTLVTDPGQLRVMLSNLRIRPQATILHDRRQIVNVRDVVNEAFFGGGG